MKIKLKSPLIVVYLVVLVNFSSAKNAQKRRPSHIEAAHESEDHYLEDQIASETIQYTNTANNVVVPPPHAVSEQHFRDQKYDDHKYVSKSSSKNGQTSSHERHRVHEKKPDYLAPMKNSNSPREYVESALKIRNNFVQRESHVPTHEEVPASSFFEYTTVNYDEPKKISSKPKKTIYQEAEEGINFHHSTNKKIKPTPNTSTPKASMKKVKLTGERHFYQPESADAEIYREASDGDGVSNYHYYYPPVIDTEEVKPKKPEFHIKKKQPTVEILTTESPKFVYKQYPVYHTAQTVQSSTDQYQYPPVLQRPENYEISGVDGHGAESKPLEYYYPPLTHQNSHNVAIKSTASPHTPSPIKLRVSTKRPETHETRYFSPSTHSPSAMPSPTPTADHAANIKVKYIQPTKKPFNHQHFYASPSPALQYNTDSTIYKYSTPTATTVQASIHFSKPSTKPPVSSTLTPDLDSDDSTRHTVIIQPKTQYHRHVQHPKKEQPKHIIYAYSDPSAYKPDNYTFSRQTQPTHPTFFNSLHAPTFHDNHNSTQPIMNYNYKTEYFTEQDANHGDAMHGEIMKVNPKVVAESQKAEKKNEFYQNDFFQNQNVPYMRALEEREMPPPRNQHHNIDDDQQQEASKNHHQYVVLYQLEEERKKEEKKQQQNIQHHHHHHEHEQQHLPEQHNNYYYETSHSEHSSPHNIHDLESEILGSESFRIFDSKKSSRPYEISKDDYMRHIKQAAMQYMKEMNEKDMRGESNSPKNYYTEITNQQARYNNRPKSSDSDDGSYKKKPVEPIKIMATLKLPKNTFQAGKQLSDAIDNLREAGSNVDLTFKKAKATKPFDLSAIDVGQTYQHVSFDHSAALKNTEDFDQTNVVNQAPQPQKPRLHFNQQTYYDINAMGHNNPNNKNRDREQEGTEPESVKLFKGYVLPDAYGMTNKGKANLGTSISFDGNKLPRIVNQDDENDENGRPDAIDTPIQIINGIPVANPYNIDMNTLKYMLGGVAQAQVNDQLKDFDETPSKSNWKSFNPNKHFSDDPQNYPTFGNPVASGTSHSETFSTLFNNNNSQRKKKNAAGQTGNYMNQPQKNQFPLLNQLVNNVRSTRNNNQENGPSMSFNDFMKSQLNSENNRNNDNNSPHYQNHRNNDISHNNHRNNEFSQNSNKKSPSRFNSSSKNKQNVFGNNNPNVNFGFQDMNYNSWDQSKKRYEPQASSYHPQIAHTNGQRLIVKPVNKKRSRNEKPNNLGVNKNFKQPDRELRPPPKMPLHNIN